MGETRSPPVAKKVEHAMHMFGDVRVDNYYWLRDDSRCDPDMLSYLRAENEYTDSVMSGTKQFENQLFAEIRGRIKEDDISAPLRKGPYYYYKKNLQGKEYVQHCRRLVADNKAEPSVHDTMPTGPDAPPEHIILDENLKAQEHGYYRIGTFKTSPDHKLVAYAEDTKGDEIYAVHVIYRLFSSLQISVDPYFKTSRLSLLDRGFIYVIAHVRGGGEMGRQWYEDGKLLKKKNTFTDFIACAESLIDLKYCSKEKLCVEGRSAGGLLMGAVLNMRPDLLKVVVAGVPFVDALTTMLDPTIPLTTSEWEEWGDPRKEEYYFYMKSYSPVDNVTAQNYPNILVTAGLNDPRVMYSEPAKFVAKLREMKTDNNLLLFKCELGAGHFSKSGRFEKLQEDAFKFAFMMKVLDMIPASV
ncbi:hypothetical protein YC2023_043687 [Brassica napus]